MQPRARRCSWVSTRVVTALLTQALNLPHDKVDVRLDLVDFALDAEDSIDCPLCNHGNDHDKEQEENDEHVPLSLESDRFS